jgi:rhodanese-related sulfurtransferase
MPDFAASYRGVPVESAIPEDTAPLWASAWIIVGYAFAEVIGFVVTRVARVGKPLVILLAGALAVYLVLKYVRRRRFLRHLQKARITAQELKRRLEAGDHLVIVDLRTGLDIETAPYAIPGACQIAPEDLPHPHVLIPPGSEVVFYCAEPKEATSARLALRLAALGFHNVHPLRGGSRAGARPASRWSPSAPLVLLTFRAGELSPDGH